MKLPFLNIISANTEIGRLETELTAVKAELATLTETAKVNADKVSEYEKTIAAFSLDETKATMEKTIADMTAAHELVIKELTEKVELAEKASAEKAAAIVATIGVSDEAIPASTKEDNNIFTSKRGSKITKVI